MICDVVLVNINAQDTIMVVQLDVVLIDPRYINMNFVRVLGLLNVSQQSVDGRAGNGRCCPIHPVRYRAEEPTCQVVKERIIYIIHQLIITTIHNFISHNR